MPEIAIYTNPQMVEVKEYHGQRVITFKDIDALHQRPEGTARRNFNENKQHFIESEDYFHLSYDEIRRTNFVQRPNSQGLILITKMGYLMLVKSFTDDSAWHIQRQLVKTYFGHSTPAVEAVNNSQLERLIALLERQYQTAQPAQLPPTPYDADVKYLLKRIEESGCDEISKRDLYDMCKGKFKKVEAMEPALNVLAAMGYLQGEKILTGGRPSTLFTVNTKPKTDLNSQKLLSHFELADYLGVGRNKAFDLLHTEGFPTVRIGRRIFADRVKLDKWIDEQGTKSTAETAL